jgi:hypothetical protein
MKQTILALLLTCGVGGLAMAQPAPQPSPGNSPPPSYPQSTAPTPADSGTASTSDKHAMMKQCVAQQEQQAASSGMSKKDIKEYCKKQVKEATSSAPQQSQNPQ